MHNGLCTDTPRPLSPPSPKQLGVAGCLFPEIGVARGDVTFGDWDGAWFTAGGQVGVEYVGVGVGVETDVGGGVRVYHTLMCVFCILSPLFD